MRRHLLLIAAVFVSTSCGDSSGPRAGHPGLTLVSGYNLTDTVEAKPVKALVVEVRDDKGAIVPQGTIVRFEPVATSYFQTEMRVGELTSTSFATFASAETDGGGRAAVLVQMGTIAGPARIAISVPTLGVQDTARYTVLPGQPSAIFLTPYDTAVYADASYTIHGGVVDRWANPRTDPVVYTASPGASVSSTGVVSASTIGRYTLTGTAGAVSQITHFSVVPQGTLAVLTNRSDGLHYRHRQSRRIWLSRSHCGERRRNRAATAMGFRDEHDHLHRLRRRIATTAHRGRERQGLDLLSQSACNDDASGGALAQR